MPRRSRNDFSSAKHITFLELESPSSVLKRLASGRMHPLRLLVLVDSRVVLEREVQLTRSERLASESWASGVWSTTSPSILCGCPLGQPQQMHLRETGQSRAGAVHCPRSVLPLPSAELAPTHTHRPGCRCSSCAELWGVMRPGSARCVRLHRAQKKGAACSQHFGVIPERTSTGNPMPQIETRVLPARHGLKRDSTENADLHRGVRRRHTTKTSKEFVGRQAAEPGNMHTTNWT